MCSLFSRKLFNTSRFLYKTSYTRSCEIVKLSRTILNRRLYSNDESKKLTSEQNEQATNESSNLAPGIKMEYKEFRDEDAEIIFDVEEEKEKINLEKIIALEHEVDPYVDLNRERGITGVFEIEELVDILKKNKAQNIFVAQVPPEYAYVNHIVIVTGKSQKHMSALATYIRKAFKLKMHPTDIVPKIEGEDSKEWVALDLDNIALHIFSTDAREKYDLETLWGIGPEYDKSEEQSGEDEFINRYKEFLATLQPADFHESKSSST
ncbi:mitochondrial assembly of ribosomal large subunit protein 1 [Chelonus insularis]|uniref:mitochondrial assembly of ribosomal large subunit protein 1 n=1 Tax=Chelonus insularis TaxID=460826 RepID=UPI00158E3B29|nr:mitochondrial assembly of ribosomal large subunit protein 1 [Chelonus insularis]